MLKVTRLSFVAWQAGKFKVAKFQYGRVVEYLQFSDALEGEHGVERDRLLLAAHLNLALCHLKLGNDAAARDSANRALELDNKSEKALFRRGLVCLSLMSDGLFRILERGLFPQKSKSAVCSFVMVICWTLLL